jgi:hypothetical protein
MRGTRSRRPTANPAIRPANKKPKSMTARAAARVAQRESKVTEEKSMRSICKQREVMGTCGDKGKIHQ